ncbi:MULTISPECIES: hypothetical protein [unclassified Virgibacillus]|uniref:hypothetical protein n=1 Tax=unclassified Virgibacillus TaxID=2620237 RepID=UPI00090BAC69|nr:MULTISPECIES: hypothetical protein [unclassified Virgibacillus]API93492.1 hypothetical protein BKP57_17765 [Virgibacillus sp. 6R]MBS7430121.1 hypothetical protein [Virgibacillus sp. 19R1-5]
MTNENNWAEKRKELERQLIDAKQKVMHYDRNLRPYRTVTESEYREAKRDLICLATEIRNGDHEVTKPADPYEGMSVAQLKQLFDDKKAEYKGGAGSSRQAAELLTINTRIQALEAGEASE